MSTWHNLSSTEVLTQLKSSDRGLTSAEAAHRLLSSTPSYQAPAYLKYKKALAPVVSSPYTYLLVLAAILSWATEEHAEAIIIAAVLLINTGITLFLTWRAERAAAALRLLTPSVCVALRDGAPVELPPQALVVGDVVLLTAGQRIPADMRVLTEHYARANESTLTGESGLVLKQEHPVSASATLSERYSMLYAGTTIAYGTVTGVVTAVGDATEYGSTVLHTQTIDRPPTALEKRITEQGLFLGKVALVITAIYALIALAQGQAPQKVLLTAVALMVAAVPEGLPLLTGAVLMISSLSLAKRGALVQQPESMETLGTIKTVITDKTGTLTENALAVTGALLFRHKDSILWKLGSSHQSGVRDLFYSAESSCEYPLRDPLEIAIHEAANQYDRTTPRVPILSIPFSSEVRISAQISERNGVYILSCKGSLEAILQRIHMNHEATPEAIKQFADLAEAQEKVGDKVIAIATKRLTGAEFTQLKDATRPEKLLSDLQLVGALVLQDQLRPDAAETIAELIQDGYDVRMATGDTAAAARSVAEAVGIPHFHVHNGPLTTRSSRTISLASIFSRVAPQDKASIVRELRKNGPVAMLGDGVNDAAALNAADVGLAVYESGNDTTSGVADVLLTRSGIATVHQALLQGASTRSLLEILTLFLIATNIGELLAVVITGTFYREPVLSIEQVLWLNILSDSILILPFLGLTTRKVRQVFDPKLSLKVFGATSLLVWSILTMVIGHPEWALTGIVGLQAGFIVALITETYGLHDKLFEKTMLANSLAFLSILVLNRINGPVHPIEIATLAVIYCLACGILYSLTRLVIRKTRS